MLSTGNKNNIVKCMLILNNKQKCMVATVWSGISWY